MRVDNVNASGSTDDVNGGGVHAAPQNVSTGVPTEDGARMESVAPVATPGADSALADADAGVSGGPPAANVQIRIEQGVGVSTGVDNGVVVNPDSSGGNDDDVASELTDRTSVRSVVGKIFGGWRGRRGGSPGGVSSISPVGGAREPLLLPAQVTSYVVPSFELSDESADLAAAS